MSISISDEIETCIDLDDQSSQISASTGSTSGALASSDSTTERTCLMREPITIPLPDDSQVEQYVQNEPFKKDSSKVKPSFFENKTVPSQPYLKVYPAKRFGNKSKVQIGLVWCIQIMVRI